METLELECPSCGELLELDAGFAGSVCRCSHCGAMMSVPTDPNASAERVDRPDRPDAPTATRPEAPTTPDDSDSDDENLPSREESDATESTATPEHERAGRATTPAQATAQKRSKVRMLTVSLVVLAALALVAWTVGALVVTLGGETDGGDTLAELGYDPDVNPYTMTELNALGLPLDERSVVVVDASGSSRRWLALVQDAVRVGLTRDQGAAEVGLIYATEAAPQPLNDTLQWNSQLDAEQLHSFQQGITARGVAPLRPAVEKALEWNAARIVLVTGQSLDEAQTETLKAALAQNEDVIVDLVLVDETSTAAETLAEAWGGRYVRLSLGQLRQWYRAAEVPTP